MPARESSTDNNESPDFWQSQEQGNTRIEVTSLRSHEIENCRLVEFMLKTKNNSLKLMTVIVKDSTISFRRLRSLMRILAPSVTSLINFSIVPKNNRRDRDEVRGILPPPHLFPWLANTVTTQWHLLAHKFGWDNKIVPNHFVWLGTIEFGIMHETEIWSTPIRLRKQTSFLDPATASALSWTCPPKSSFKTTFCGSVKSTVGQQPWAPQSLTMPFSGMRWNMSFTSFHL